MGRLLDTLLDNMDKKLQQQQQQRSGVSSSSGNGNGSSSSTPQQQQQSGHPKLMMYSGHDSTIMPLLTG